MNEPLLEDEEIIIDDNDDMWDDTDEEDLIFWDLLDDELEDE